MVASHIEKPAAYVGIAAHMTHDIGMLLFIYDARRDQRHMATQLSSDILLPEVCSWFLWRKKVGLRLYLSCRLLRGC
jgi:hypothetical protein